jgi:hypothetical protein
VIVNDDTWIKSIDPMLRDESRADAQSRRPTASPLLQEEDPQQAWQRVSRTAQPLRALVQEHGIDSPNRPVKTVSLGGAVTRLATLSDVHLDRQERDLHTLLPHQDEYDVLVVAGDVGSPEDAVEKLARIGRPVVYVLGNHERYGADLDDAVARAQAAAKGTDVHVLEKDVAVIGGVRFVGCTLWTDFGGPLPHPGALASGCWMHDGSRIRADRFGTGNHRQAVVDAANALGMDAPEAGTWAPLVHAMEHAISRRWLERQVETAFDGPTVVVTHHAPSLTSSAPQVRRHGALTGSDIDFRLGVVLRLWTVYGYSSEMEDLLLRLPDALWVHGHVPQNVDYRVGNVRVFCNNVERRGRASIVTV